MEEQKKGIRKHYIDNLRNLTILLLFPVHTFMIWNDFGSRFYIWQGENKLLSTLIVLVNPWFMPILFVLAGMSARYALEKRTNKEFVMQRVRKLFIPFISGMIFLVPFQTLYARKFFNNYEGSLLDNWKYFFTHLTDFSGYDGAFTPGHLWFILFLFFISMIALILFCLVPYEKTAVSVEKIPVLGVLVLLVAAKTFLNKRTGFTEYFNQASYPIYILHQSILVALAYYVVQISDVLFVQVFCICMGSFLLTVLAYHLIKLIPVVRKMIGIK